MSWRELVEQDPNDEPASVLLEKIKNAKASVKASDPRGSSGLRGAHPL